MCGVRSKDIQEELLTKPDLSLARAQEIAEGMEAASCNTQQRSTQYSTPLLTSASTNSLLIIPVKKDIWLNSADSKAATKELSLSAKGLANAGLGEGPTTTDLLMLLLTKVQGRMTVSCL